ncbi:MAG TPA: hypothetical protein VLT84_06005 [Acidobacteriota bacterium]|nr:hypothetical protein [Acidobacteriota bacterium]
MQDPEPYLRNLGVQVPCIVDPKRLARIDTSLRRRIGHDLFYFSSAQAMKRFDRDPLKYVKRLSDPITARRFPVQRRSRTTEFSGRTYYFAVDSTIARFLSEPERWKERRAAAMEGGAE